MSLILKRNCTRMPHEKDAADLQVNDGVIDVLQLQHGNRFFYRGRHPTLIIHSEPQKFYAHLNIPVCDKNILFHFKNKVGIPP